MSKYCVACGTALSGGRFCGSCGHEAAAPVVESTLSPESDLATISTADTSADAAAAAAPSPRRRRRIGALSAGVAILTSVAVLTGLAMNSQAAQDAGPSAEAVNAAQEASTTAAQTVTESGDATERRLLKAKIKARAELKAEREAAAAAEAEAAATPAVAPAPNSSGDWAGTMASGKYTYYLTIEESGGDVWGSMYQQSNEDGDSGTEELSGYRSGNTLYLQGQSWSSDAPNNWGLDSFTIELSPDGGSMSGTYTCDVCSTTNSLSGTRTYGDY